jgi:hypothetical protein
MTSKQNLYINNQNQQLLWATINKTPMFSVFGAGVPNYRETWFRNIVQIFYNKYPVVNDLVSLQRINKETISFMIESIKSNLPIHAPIGTPDSIPNINSYKNSDYIGKDAERIKKQEVYNSAFEQRQQQYEQLFAKPPAPEVNFSEKLDDAPITNMDELIEKHKREREEELNKYAPIQQILPQGQSVTPIIEETVKILPKKQVHFSETNNNYEKQEKLQIENNLSKTQSDSEIIIFLKNKIEELSSKYEQLESEIKELKNLNKITNELPNQIKEAAEPK